jgi:hypothetical protein
MAALPQRFESMAFLSVTVRDIGIVRKQARFFNTEEE